MTDKPFDLESMTFNDVEGIGRRVFYTLTDESSETKHRTQKLLAHLIEKLVAKNMLNEDDVDGMLKDDVM